MQNEFLYHSHTVQAHFKDGRIVEGKMTVAAPQDNALTSIEIDGTAYGAEEVADIRYLGRLLNYSASSQTGQIDSYSFDGGDCPESAEFGRMIYREQEYQVSCHLEVRQNAIRAVDVKVLRRAHVLNEELLTAERAFYRLADGRWVIGLLDVPGAEGETFSILTDRRERIAFSKWEVADITRVPAVNDIVTAKTAGGASVHGIVSAVEEDRMLIIADMLPQMVCYRDLEELRYQGIVTEGWQIDFKYYSSASFCPEEAEEPLREKVSVSYVAGVNSRHWIAKDIRLVRQAEEAPQKPPLNRYGIILMISRSALPAPDDCGYIGPEYHSKACGTRNGNVCFQRRQLPFPYDHMKGIYVVRYSVRHTADSNKHLQVERMELVEVVDCASFGIVRVDEEGKVEKVPLYRALPQRYKDREVDVLCRGAVFSGVLIAQEEKGIWLKMEENRAERISCDEIETVRIRGKVTAYNSPVEGAGLIDGDLFFQISDVNELVRAMIREGAPVSYELCNFYKSDNKLGCKNIDVAGGIPGILEGYATELQGETIRIVPAAQYGTGEEGAFFTLLNAREIHAGLLDLKRHDFALRYRLRGQGAVEVISVDESKKREKIFYGYLDAYYNAKEFGYITPKAYYDKMPPEERRTGMVDVWCRTSVFVNTPERLDTYQYVYYVRYTLNRKISPGMHACAGSVVFLERLAKSRKKAPVPVKKKTFTGEGVPETVPGLIEGETFFYRTESGEIRLAESAHEEKDREIWRLGVLTDLDDIFQAGCLNRGVRFPFSVMESRTFNRVASEKKSVLLSYRTKEGKVSWAERMSQEMLGQIPWTRGTVTGVLVKETERVILIDGKVRHYISGLTDGLINRLAKNGTLAGKSLFYRQVVCPVWNGQGGAELMAVAAEVNCEETEAVIFYDEVLERYTARRDQFRYTEVKASASALQKLVGSSAAIRFVPDETRLRLEVYLEQGENEDSDAE